MSLASSTIRTSAASRISGMAGAAPNTADIVDDVALRRAVVGCRGSAQRGRTARTRRRRRGSAGHDGAASFARILGIPPEAVALEAQYTGIQGCIASITPRPRSLTR
jgi:hypothetical protein